MRLIRRRPRAHEVSQPTQHQSQIHLPIEIWALIFEMILDPLAEPYNFCMPSTFPLYQNYYFSSSFRMDYARDGKDHYSIRLVCRSWCSISGPLRKATLDSLKSPTLHPGLKHLTIRCTKQHLIKIVGSPHVARNITTLVLCAEPAVRRRYDTPVLLLGLSSSFPALRSLTMDGGPYLYPYLYLRLEKSFPLLISLTFLTSPRLQPFNHGQSISVTLSHLQILDFDWPHAINLHFPKLKHLCIQNIIVDTSFLDFLNAHAHQLESFVMPTPYWVLHRDQKEHEFWDLCPNLQTFGVSFSFLYQIRGPPSSHPLKYLRIFLPTSTISGAYVIDVKSIIEGLSRFPQVETLYVDQSILDETISAHCRTRGVTCITIPSNPTTNPIDAILRLTRKKILSTKIFGHRTAPQP